MLGSFSISSGKASIDSFNHLSNSTLGITYSCEKIASNRNFPDDEIIFKIEIKRSIKKIELTPSNFNKLNNIEEHLDNGTYVYTYGSSKNKSYAENVLLKHVQGFGYTTAKIIAYEGDKIIPIQNINSENSIEDNHHQLIEPSNDIEYFQSELETNDISDFIDTSESFELNPTLGIGTGLLTYFGDITPYDQTSKLGKNIGLSIFLSSKMNKYLTGGFRFIKGTLTVDERADTRNLNFQSKISAGGIFVSHNLTNWISDKSKIRPYITMGIEALEFNSKSDNLDADGNTYFYWSDGTIRTEPQLGTNTNAPTTVRDNIYETDLRELDLDGLGRYNQFSFAVPVGGGVEIQLTEKLKLNLGTSLHMTFTDLIDNVSDKGIGERKGESNLEKFLYTTLSLHFDLFDKKPKEIEEPIDSNMLAVNKLDSVLTDSIEDPSDTSLTNLPYDLDSANMDGITSNMEGYDPKSFDQDSTLDNLPYNSDSANMDDASSNMEGYNKKGFDQDSTLDNLPYNPDSANMDDASSNMEGYNKKGFDQDSTLDNLPYNSDSANMDDASSNMAQFSLDTTNTKSNTNEYDLSTIIRKDSVWTPENTQLNNNSISKTNKEIPKDSIWQVLLGVFPKGEYPSEEFENKILSIPGLKSQVVNDTVFYTAPNASVDASGFVFRVQLGAFSKQIPNGFFKMDDVIMIPGQDGLFKYVTGTQNDYYSARAHRQKMIKMGFEGAFVVAYHEGKRVSIQSAGIKPQDLERIQQEETNISLSKLTFKIQLLASKNSVYNAPANFKGLENIEEYFSEGLYKYTSGSTEDFGYANDVLLGEIKRLGYKDAFVVAFRKGKRVKRIDVINYLNKDK